MKPICQMTISPGTEFPGGSGKPVYCKCNKPAKFISPKVIMGVKYLCGIHARSVNKMYERTGQKLRCQLIGAKTQATEVQ